MNPNRTLFPLRPDFRVVRLASHDAAKLTDHLLLLQGQIIQNEAMYPGIDQWFKRRVVPGLRTGERVAYLGFEGDTPILTAIAKRGEQAKFCHLRIAGEFQDSHLGEAFFAIMALEVRTTAKEIHFTLPEGLWTKRRAFFESFGFHQVVRSKAQYRLFEEELRASAPFQSVWQAAREKLPKLTNCFSINNYATSPNLVFSIRPKFAHHLMNGEKTVEIRRRFQKRWSGSRVAIYASSPERSLVGEATIEAVEAGRPQDVWAKFGDRTGCSHEEFDTYTEGSEEVYAIVLRDVSPYESRIPLCQFEYLLDEELAPPQSYCEVRPDLSWGKAVSIAALLHSCGRRSTAHERFP